MLMRALERPDCYRRSKQGHTMVTRRALPRRLDWLTQVGALGLVTPDLRRIPPGIHGKRHRDAAGTNPPVDVPKVVREADHGERCRVQRSGCRRDQTGIRRGGMLATITNVEQEQNWRSNQPESLSKEHRQRQLVRNLGNPPLEETEDLGLAKAILDRFALLDCIERQVALQEQRADVCHSVCEVWTGMRDDGLQPRTRELRP